MYNHMINTNLTTLSWHEKQKTTNPSFAHFIYLTVNVNGLCVEYSYTVRMTWNLNTEERFSRRIQIAILFYMEI